MRFTVSKMNIPTQSCFHDIPKNSRRYAYSRRIFFLSVAIISHAISMLMSAQENQASTARKTTAEFAILASFLASAFCVDSPLIALKLMSA